MSEEGRTLLNLVAKRFGLIWAIEWAIGGKAFNLAIRLFAGVVIISAAWAAVAYALWIGIAAGMGWPIWR